jgi:hypothetical protein
MPKSTPTLPMGSDSSSLSIRSAKRQRFMPPDMEQPLHHSGDATLDLTDVIPSFQIKLSSLFEKLSNPLAKN